MAATKVLMLKPENGHTLLKTQVVKGVTTLMPITSVKDKAQRRLEVKARINTAQAVNSALGVSTASTRVNTAKINNLSDAVICTFLASQLSSPQLVNEDLKQICSDDLEEMDLRRQMAIFDNEGQKTNMECYNCHKRGHFARECGASRSQDTKHKESTRRIVPMETPASTALIPCDDLGGYDWSHQDEEGPNYALMDYTSTNSDSKIVDSCKKGLGYEIYNAVSPPYTKNFMPLKPDLFYIGLDELVVKPIVKNKSSKEETKAVRKNLDAPIVKEWCQMMRKRMPIQKEIAFNNSNVNQRVNTVRSKTVNTAKPKALVNVVQGNVVNFVKASTSWVWKPKTKVIDHVSKHNSASITLKKFENVETCVACQKGKQCKASCKTKIKNSISLPLHLLHMDLFGPTFVKRLMKKMYCLVVTDDYSRFTWVFFLSTKDETSGILKSFITRIENLVIHKVKMIRYDNRTEFKNNANEEADMNNMDATIQVSPVPTTRIHKDHPLDRKVEKALYGLHQAPRGWYETLSTYLLYNGFHKGKINKTLFIRRHKGDIFLVQVYVDDIIFSSTKKELCIAFEKMIHEKFQMISMGELTFFLGLQVKQKQDEIFISQDKYATETLKKCGFTKVKNVSTPIETQKPLLKDEDGEEVDVYMYRSMIGSLLYLTFSRPDIMFVVCACATYQVNPKVSHLHAVKRIFRASLDRKSITGGCQFFGFRLISWQCKKQTMVANFITEAKYMVASSFCGQTTAKARTINEEAQIHAKVDGKKVVISEASIRRDLQFGDEEGVDCLPTATILEQLGLMGVGTWIMSLENFDVSEKIFRNMRKIGKGFSGNITPLFLTMVIQNPMGKGSAIPTDPQHTPIILQPFTSQQQKTKKHRKPRRKVTKVPQPSDSIKNVADEAGYKELDDSLVRVAITASILEAEQDSGNTLQTDEDSMKLNELMELCTTLQSRVLDLEKTQTTQALDIYSLKRRVKKLKKKQKSRTHKLKRLYKERISDIDADEGITLVSTHDDVEMFNADKDLHVEGITLVSTHDDVEMFNADKDLHGEEENGKAIMIEEPGKLKKKDQIMLDEEVALKLQAELQAKFDKEHRLATKIDVDYLLAQRLQEEEQQELTDAEKATLFMQFLKKKRKFFAAKVKEEKRNKSPTQAQQRKIMCTYLRNMEGKKLKELNNKSFDSIYKMFDKDFKRVNTFEPISSELVEGSSKSAGTELEQESSKKQKINYDKEKAELKQLVKIIPDEEGAAVDAIPLAVKPPSIVDWKIHKEGKKIFYKIIMADGSSRIYLDFSHMLKSFYKEDVETLWKLTSWWNALSSRGLVYLLVLCCEVVKNLRISASGTRLRFKHVAKKSVWIDEECENGNDWMKQTLMNDDAETDADEEKYASRFMCQHSEQKQITPTPTPTRSPRTALSLDDNFSKSSSDSLLKMTVDYPSEKSNQHKWSEVLEQDKELFEVLSKGADVLKPGKDTFRTGDLCKRSHGDPDHDHHEVEKAKKQKIVVKLVMSDMLDWMNPESHLQKEVYIPDDNTEPPVVFGPLNNLNLPAKDFFNHDLEYLEHGKAQDEKYTLSITKYLATPYDRHDMEEHYDKFIRKVVRFDKDNHYGIHHWPELRRGFYIYKMHFPSKAKVYSKSKIKGVVEFKEMNRSGYNFLIRFKVVKENGNTYVFSKADYGRLHLNDIKDLYLMKIQRKLKHLTLNIMDSLLIFIIRAVIMLRVEKLQFRLESYQKRLNIKRPKLTFSGIKDVEPYTLIRLIKASLLKKDTTNKETKSTMREFAVNDQAYYYSGITTNIVNEKNSYELKGKFLDDLCKNAFGETHEEDAIKHIEYFLKIVDPIDLPNLNQDKLRVVVFPISLAGDAWRWFDGIKRSITSWVDLTTKFFRKYHPLSRTGKINNPIIKWDPTNPNFENWLASKFVYYKTMDIFTKGALSDYWNLGSDETEPTNEETFDLEEADNDDKQEIGEIFRIETDFFDYETPLIGFKTNEETFDLKDDWIYEWNENIPWDGELKDEGLKNKAIMEALIDEDEESNNEEYVVVKEDEYDDLTSTSKDACRAHQEIFRIIDEGWMKAFDAFCEKFHIPEEVHPVLPNQGNMMHERPADKVGLYTMFFDFANFRLPLSTFLIDILRDPDPVAADFNVQDYATLVAHPSLFRKFPEEFLCLVGLSRHYTLDEETCPLFLDK
nr:hypothetical protein [Tanacetum cinerariifolium]